MKKYVLALFLSLFGSLFATISEPLTIDIATGYKIDFLNWKALSDTSEQFLYYQEKYQNVNYLQTSLNVRTISRDFYLFGGSDYSLIGSGSLRQKMGQLDFTSRIERASFSTEGYDISGFGVFGYLINLTPDRFNKIILIPYFGYSGDYRRLKGRQPHPALATLSNSAAEIDYTTLALNLSRHWMHESWYGLTIGGSVKVISVWGLVFDFFYYFHWLDLKHKSYVCYLQNDYSAADVLLSSYEVEKKFKSDGSFGSGHVWLGKLSYDFLNHWQLGGVLKYHYYAAKNTHINTKITTKEIYPASSTVLSESRERFISRWYYISAQMMLSFVF